jgi:simple sugar transport system ATP-binding protein
MIYQDFALCGNMDVGQNIFLGRWPVKGWSGGRQQSVAIARAISFDPRVIILDEPTANLSVTATQRLLETMLELKKHGVAQIIISHRLQAIFAVGDRIMVLKRGENVGERVIAETSEYDVLQQIVAGKPVKAMAAQAV